MRQVPDLPLDGLYGDKILDHYRNPRHRDPVRDADVEAEEFNPFCGDRVTVQLKLDSQGRVEQVSTRAEGCSIIQATASMMAEALAGMTIGEAEELSRRFYDMMQGRGTAEEGTAGMGDLRCLEIVRQFPVRIKCALLPWMALEEGTQAYRSIHD